MGQEITDRPDYLTKATQAQIKQALASLSTLRTAKTEAAEFDQASYLVALDGVSAWCLRASIKSILQGGIGHGWYPSPPEWRIHCDKLMKPITEQLTRERREEAARQQAAEDRKRTAATNPQEAARVRAIYASFKQHHEREKIREQANLPAELPAERADRMRRILALPDAPGLTGEQISYRRVVEASLPQIASIEPAMAESENQTGHNSKETENGNAQISSEGSVGSDDPGGSDGQQERPFGFEED